MSSTSVRPGDLIQLARLKIMLPVSLTGFAGYFIYDPHISVDILLVTAGIFLMAVAASVLNQIQEKNIDPKMSRTSGRPLPARRITTGQASIIFFLCLIAGTYTLFYSGNLKAALTGLLTLVWYNGVYTNLKRITHFAVIPGAVTGALPPLIGWLAAGGGLWDKEIILIEFLFFTGQIPHFWLLLLRYRDDYHNAGIPNLMSVFTEDQVRRLTFVCVVISVVAAMLLCIFGIILNTALTAVLMILSAALLWKFSDLLKTDFVNGHYRKYSMLFDLFFFLLIILMITDKIIRLQ